MTTQTDELSHQLVELK